MRDNATAIYQVFEKMGDIDKLSALNAMIGVLEYLKEKMKNENIN